MNETFTMTIVFLLLFCALVYHFFSNYKIKSVKRFIETPGMDEVCQDVPPVPGDGSELAYCLADAINGCKLELLMPMHPYRKEALEANIIKYEKRLEDLIPKKKDNYVPGAGLMIMLMSGMFRR